MSPSHFQSPGKYILAWIRVSTGAKLCYHNSFLSHCSYIRIAPNKPRERQEREGIQSIQSQKWPNKVDINYIHYKLYLIITTLTIKHMNLKKLSSIKICVC